MRICIRIYTYVRKFALWMYIDMCVYNVYSSITS